ncbi:hypothetical protein MPSEU_000808500 [Mayamaea pseudoterrestris]|nr:hypothetical protein MPSEU_000808500 [Mayamaea pseudoterrestris]
MGGLKRVRTPHYIAGLGDGNVKVAEPKKARDWNANVRRREKDPRLAAQEHPALSSAERFDLYFKDLQEATSSTNRVAGRHRHPTTPWHFSAWAMLLTIILLGAFFLHILSDSQTQDRKLYRRSRAARAWRRAKKKTDEWNEDEDDNHDIDESFSQSQDLTTEASNGENMAMNYYPYHTPDHGLHVQQQHRHRRKPSNLPMPAANAAAAVATAYPPPQPSYQHSPLLLGAVSPAAASSFAGKSPCSSTRSSRLVVNVNPGISPIPERAVMAQHLYAPPQRTTMNPQPLSTASSFSTTTPDSDRPLRTPRTRCELTDRRLATDSTHNASPALGPRMRPRENHLLLSPGHDDQLLGCAAAEKSSPAVDFLVFSLPPPAMPTYSGAIEGTPRIGNQRRILPRVDGYMPQLPDQKSGSSSPLRDDAFQFASSPYLRRRADEPQSDESLPFPFIPTLQRQQQQTQGPPMSVKLDDLQLYQMMESGNVSHWKARVAEESRQLEDRIATSHGGSSRSELLVAADASDDDTDSSYEMLSNDPRKNIQHKRADLTSSTNASASLQGAIDFKELKLVDVIGGGGFGQVWRAIWNGTPVAVKILTGSAQSKNIPKPVLQEFVAEINLLKGMRHPNICLYMGACLDHPNRAIITELAANGSLWDALRLPLCPPYIACDGQTRQAWPMRLYLPDARHGAPPGPSSRLPPPIPPRDTWPWELVKRVACGAARGMAYLHSGKPPVLHRDLKSANILLDESYTAKVCDFGLSRLKANDSMTGSCGTVQWMAPEVLSNMSYDEKADIYSYGIILWELLSRLCPYDGMTPIQCALAVLNRDQRPEIPKWCPPSLQTVIRSCIKRVPEERPTFSEIIAAFDGMP